jgi:hypothetical protein
MKRLVRAGLLLLTMAMVGACERAPTDLLSPGEADMSQSSAGWQKVHGELPAFSVSGVIGRQGGSIGVPGYTLTVPRNAVSAPTVFTFTSVNDGYMQVRATATAVGSDDVNDVGRAGFRTPVYIQMSFHPAGGPQAWSRLAMAWLGDDGTIHTVPTYVNVAQKVVTGRAQHFSEYLLVWPATSRKE